MEVADYCLGGLRGGGEVLPLRGCGDDVDEADAEDGEGGVAGDGEAVRDAGAAVVAD